MVGLNIWPKMYLLRGARAEIGGVNNLARRSVEETAQSDSTHLVASPAVRRRSSPSAERKTRSTTTRKGTMRAVTKRGTICGETKGRCQQGRFRQPQPGPYSSELTSSAQKMVTNARRAKQFCSSTRSNHWALSSPPKSSNANTPATT